MLLMLLRVRMEGCTDGAHGGGELTFLPPYRVVHSQMPPYRVFTLKCHPVPLFTRAVPHAAIELAGLRTVREPHRLLGREAAAELPSLRCHAHVPVAAHRCPVRCRPCLAARAPCRRPCSALYYSHAPLSQPVLSLATSLVHEQLWRSRLVQPCLTREAPRAVHLL